MSLPRRTPLRSYTRLRRRTGLKAVSDRRRKVNRLRRKVKEALVRERGEACEAQVEGVCDGRAVDANELKRRSQGGSITDGRNIILVCRPCHEWITTHPVGAAERGLLVWSWGDAEGEALPPGGVA